MIDPSEGFQVTATLPGERLPSERGALARDHPEHRAIHGWRPLNWMCIGSRPIACMPVFNLNTPIKQGLSIRPLDIHLLA